MVGASSIHCRSASRDRSDSSACLRHWGTDVAMSARLVANSMSAAACLQFRATGQLHRARLGRADPSAPGGERWTAVEYHCVPLPLMSAERWWSELR